VYSTGQTVGNEYVYPYALQFVDANGDPLAPNSTGVPPGTSATPWGVCDDFTAYVTGGETWLANVYTLPDLATNSADLAATTFGGLPNALQDYEAAAELSTEMTYCSPSGDCAADFNYAIWEIFDPPTGGSCSNPSSLTGGAFAAISGSDLATAQSEYCQALGGNYTPDEFPDWEVLVPKPNSEGSTYSGNGTPQEFLIDPQVNQNDAPFVTSEPATTAMLGFGGLGLLGLTFVFRRGIGWMTD
jgi:hypothetical protein